ncbi:hypothetical protein NG701_17205 [Pseudarthrobacter sp. HLT3-5]|uniref:hypothetical protein n=1 Tax=Pseudarthrobacter cellobiosi TaxID=2953654 RepID=UPI00208FD043|nr:hypothetical protein [Pseudarthrobacter sp. HLT3-5]MCO4276141.1 hypothetical protein [Pseudarthrobacter sp. HLT3-5]
MTDYPLDMQLVVDPLNPENVVRDGTVYLYDPSDEAGVSPITLKDPSGLPLTNPLTSNAYGFIQPCIVTVPRVKWKSGTFEGFFYSYDGLRNEAIAAREAAETASGDAANSAAAAASSAALVGAPADTAIAAAVSGSGATKAALSAAFVPKWKATTAYLAGEIVLSPAGDVVSAKVAFTSGASYSSANWNPSTTLTPRQFNGVFSGPSTDGVNITDTSSGPMATLRFTDTADHESSVIVITHRGAGLLGTAGGQAYGINVANQVGAKNAITIHQYSRAAPAFQIDNTDIGSAIYIKNTDNQTQNPGNYGTGAFLQFKPNTDTDALFLTDSLVWNNLTTKDMRIVGQYASQYALNIETPAGIDTRVLYVSKQGTGAGSALDVLNKGTGAGINLAQQGAGTGLNITMTDVSGAAKYGIFLSGKNYGVYFKTVTDGGNTLDIDKTGTGNGTLAKFRNLGTGDTLSLLNASGQVARFSAGGEYENLALGGGILVKAPNGTRYRIAVNNSGVVTATVS